MLSVTNISRAFGANKALDDVSLDIGVGMFGLLGPNGAGKSTFMRCLATLLAPDQGAIDLDGADILKNPQTMRERLGYLPQEFGVYPRMSAEALLEHVAVLKGVADGKARKEQVEALLKSVNLYNVRKRSVAAFSGGMKRRFGVAQALLGDPRVLIVDEPTAGLDPEERQRFLDLLSDVAEGRIILLSTHIVGDVADLCSDMAILNEGRIVARGAPASLVGLLDGKVWTKVIEKSEREATRKNHKVISLRLVGGDVVARIYSESDPGDGYELTDANLDDAYFAHLFGYVK